MIALSESKTQSPNPKDHIPASEIRSRYLRVRPFPFCPGCGGGMVLNAFSRAVHELGIPQEDILICAGIGCSSWIPSPFFKADTLHTTHGRAIAFATGAKIANPRLKVVVFTGDGDGTGIGGNHLIHAARNNIDMLVLCINNNIYGMTGGQVAPTTPHNIKTATTPYGNPSNPFDSCKLVEGAGGTFVARWTTAHIPQLIKTLKKALQHRGFSFIEIISQCPTYYGKQTGMKDAPSMLKKFKEAYSTGAEDPKMKLGEFVETEKSELCQEIEKMATNQPFFAPQKIAGGKSVFSFLSEKKNGSDGGKQPFCSAPTLFSLRSKSVDGKPFFPEGFCRKGKRAQLAENGEPREWLGSFLLTRGLFFSTLRKEKGSAGGKCLIDIEKTDIKIQKELKIRIAGRGGQGVVLAGIILGHALASCGKNVVQTQSYGAEARGGAARADVIVSGNDIYDISPERCDVLAAMSEQALERYGKDASLILIDDILETKGITVPATRIAKEEGSAGSANIGMLGGIAAVSGIPLDAIKMAIKDRMPKQAERNIRIMERCYEEVKHQKV